MYICTNSYIYIYIYTCMYVYTHTEKCEVKLWREETLAVVCGYVYVCVCVYICIHIYTIIPPTGTKSTYIHTYIFDFLVVYYIQSRQKCVWGRVVTVISLTCMSPSLHTFIQSRQKRVWERVVVAVSLTCMSPSLYTFIQSRQKRVWGRVVSGSDTVLCLACMSPSLHTYSHSECVCGDMWFLVLHRACVYTYGQQVYIHTVAATAY